MKLLFLYGAPAVGKLTVANEIAAQTNFKVFHNHLSIYAIEPIFPFGTQSFSKLIDLIRAETIAEAARVGQSLIHTFCYAKNSDDAYVAKITEIVELNGGDVCFVLLTSDRAELERRVLKKSRLQHKKISSGALLNEILDKHDLFSPVPNRESLKIDNTALAAKIVARQIIQHYNLS